MVKQTTSSRHLLDEQDYYHGFLPREDLPQLLKENGDFLVRASEPVKIGIRENILSIMCNKDYDKDDKEKGMKHFVLRRTKKTKKFKLDKISFPSVVGLIGHHLDKGTPVTQQFPQTILKSGIHRQDWELRHDNIDIRKSIGKGAFGEVHSGKLTLKTGRKVDVAIKCAKSADITQENIKEFMKEARLMRNFEHPNIVKLYGVAVEKEPLMIIMELVRGGSLDNYLRKRAASTEDKLNKMCLGAAWGLEYIHSKNCIHRDIACRNCLYDDRSKTLKIGDFGLSREGNFYQLTAMKKMPIKWLAPETLKSGRYTKESDVFAFGILIWEIYSDAAEPYDEMTNAEVQKKVMDGYRMQMPAIVPEAVVSLVNANCWDIDPEKRSAMTEVVSELQRIAGVEVEREQTKEENTKDETEDDGGKNRKTGSKANSSSRRRRQQQQKKKKK